jgi:hypothetical protein
MPCARASSTGQRIAELHPRSIRREARALLAFRLLGLFLLAHARIQLRALFSGDALPVNVDFRLEPRAPIAIRADDYLGPAARSNDFESIPGIDFGP